MSKLIIPKTTTAYREAAVPKAADLLFDTDINKMVIGDGVTPGGIVIDVSGGTTSDEVTAGFGINVVDNEVSLKRFDAIESLVSGGTVQAGHAYKLNATSSSGTTIYAEWFANGTFARDPAHIEIMVNGVGYLHLGQKTTPGSETAPFVLVGALEPDAMNNVTVRFHDGVAVMTVEDHIGGYVVISGGTSQATAGTLPYALVNTGEDASPYITFSSELNGTTFDVTGVTVTTERHVVGNGYDETKITGDVNVGTSGTLTMAAVGLQNVQVTGGTLTLGDAFIPSGSTVSLASGANLAPERVVGDGGVIDLTNQMIDTPNNINGSASGVTFECGISSFPSLNISAGGVMHFDGCVFHNTASATALRVLATRTYSFAYISNCTFTLNANIFLGAATGGISASGSNTLLGTVTGSGTVTLSSGAILDLTGNTNATPIAPGGGIVIGSDVQIYPSAGSASAVTIGGGTWTSISNNAVINGPLSYRSSDTVFSGNATVNPVTHFDIGGTTPFSFTGLTISGGSVTAYNGGGAAIQEGATATFTSCTFTGNYTAGRGGGIAILGSAILDRCVVSGNTGVYATNGAYVTGSSAVLACIDTSIDNIFLDQNGNVSIAGLCTIEQIKAWESSTPGRNGTVTISSGASINLTSSIAPGGGITVLTGGCTVNGNAIPAGTYTSINSNGQPT